MGVLLILIGLGMVIASLILSIISIKKGEYQSVGIALLVGGMLFIQAGRTINRNSKKK